MPETPTKEPEVFKPEHVDPNQIAPKAKEGIASMGDAFKAAMAKSRGEAPPEPTIAD